jgi:hypothetical protein
LALAGRTVAQSSKPWLSTEASRRSSACAAHGAAWRSMAQHGAA